RRTLWTIGPKSRCVPSPAPLPANRATTRVAPTAAMLEEAACAPHVGSSFPLQLDAERHPACAAAGAGHGNQDAKLLLLVEIGALQHVAGLLLEQLMKRQVAGADQGSVAGTRGGVSFARPRRRLGFGRGGPPDFPARLPQGEISSSTRDLVSVANK